MAINLGSETITNMMLGSTQINKVYLGSEQIWSNGPTPDPEYGEVYIYRYHEEFSPHISSAAARVTVKSQNVVNTYLADFQWTGDENISITVTKSSQTTAITYASGTATGATSGYSVHLSGSQLNEMFTFTNTRFTSTTFGLDIMGAVVDKNLGYTRRTLSSVSEFDSLATTGTADYGTVLGNVPIAAIKSVKIGKQITTTPSYFLRYASNLDSVSFSSNSSLTSIGNYFLANSSVNSPIAFPSGVTAIGTYLLYNNTAFDSMITLPNSLLSVGTGFLTGCTAFNQPLVIPPSMTTLGSYFLSGCTSFTNTIDIPNNITSVGSYFMYNCSNLTSVELHTTSCPTDTSSLSTTNLWDRMYTVGVTLTGSSSAVSAWIAALPNRTSSPYRRLFDGSSPTPTVTWTITNASGVEIYDGEPLIEISDIDLLKSELDDDGVPYTLPLNFSVSGDDFMGDPAMWQIDIFDAHGTQLFMQGYNFVPCIAFTPDEHLELPAFAITFDIVED